MIVLDIETTGIDSRKNCMVSLGAVDYESGKELYEECRIWSESEVEPIALQINGFTPTQIRDESKASPEDVYLNFYNWCEINKLQTLLGGHNIGHLDILFLEEIHRRYFPQMKWVFGYRTIDLHTLAYKKFNESLSH